MRGGLNMRDRRRITSLTAALSLMAAFAALPARAAERLAPLPVDPAQVSVAGFSSGAFMANQIHIAHSAGVMGAALIAGGLYGAAVEGVTADGVAANPVLAIARCANLPFLVDEVPAHQKLVEALAARGAIDPPSHLTRARVYLFTGGSDAFVGAGTVEKARDLYRALGVPKAHVTFEDRAGPAAMAGHAWVTTAFGEACSSNASPYVNACGYDQSGAELKAIYGPRLEPAAARATGRIVDFDQTEFAPGDAAAANGLASTGYLYIPKVCEAGARHKCRLQVALHGCTQSAEKLGDVFYDRIGLNEWADSNRLVVLYPQAHATTLPELPSSLLRSGPLGLNPGGCWNWWGYGGDSRYLTRKGVQVEAIWKMVERLEGK